MLDAGRAYCQNSKGFVNGLKELGHHCSEDRSMGVSVSTVLQRISNEQYLLYTKPMWATWYLRREMNM